MLSSSPLTASSSPLVSSLQGDLTLSPAAYTFTPPPPSSFYLSASATQSQAIPISGPSSLALSAFSSNLPSCTPTSGVIDNGLPSQSTSSTSTAQVRARSGSETGTRSHRSDSIGRLFRCIARPAHFFLCSLLSGHACWRGGGEEQ